MSCPTSQPLSTQQQPFFLAATSGLSPQQTLNQETGENATNQQVNHQNQTFPSASPHSQSPIHFLIPSTFGSQLLPIPAKQNQSGPQTPGFPLPRFESDDVPRTPIYPMLQSRLPLQSNHQGMALNTSSPSRFSQVSVTVLPDRIPQPSSPPIFHLDSGPQRLSQSFRYPDSHNVSQQIIRFHINPSGTAEQSQFISQPPLTGALPFAPAVDPHHVPSSSVSGQSNTLQSGTRPQAPPLGGAVPSGGAGKEGKQQMYSIEDELALGWRCYISHEIITDPVIFDDTVFERAELLDCVRLTGCSPITAAPLTVEEVMRTMTPDPRRKERIAQYLEQFPERRPKHT